MAEAGRAAEERSADLAGRAAHVEAAEAAVAGRAQAQADLQDQLDALKHGLAQRREDLEAAEAEVRPPMIAVVIIKCFLCQEVRCIRLCYARSPLHNRNAQ